MNENLLWKIKSKVQTKQEATNAWNVKLKVQATWLHIQLPDHPGPVESAIAKQ
jgi:hypothetical protein